MQLAARAGCSLGTIGVGERLGFLTPRMALRLARVLKVGPEELIPSSSPESGTSP